MKPYRKKARITTPQLMRAYRLRTACGLTYSAIAAVMLEYHDVDYHADQWRTALRSWTDVPPAFEVVNHPDRPPTRKAAA